jgi:hypothetical protein
MPLLRSIKIRHPQGRAMAVQDAGDDIRSTAMPHNMNDDVLILKHPVPACFTVNPNAGFIGIDHTRCAQAGQNGGNLIIKAQLGFSEHSIQSALADRQRKQMPEQLAQSVVADGVGKAQIESQRQNVGTERRPVLQACRHRRQRDPMAAWAMPGITFHPRHDRLDRRDLDLVVAAVQLVVGVLQLRRAMTAAFGLGNDGFVGIVRQKAPTPFAPEASVPLSGSSNLAAVLIFVGFESRGWRYA